MVSSEQIIDYYRSISIVEKEEASNILSVVKGVLRLLGNPHRKLKTVSLIGTQGRHFACQHLINILGRSGFKIGSLCMADDNLFEMITVNGAPISEEDFINHSDMVRRISAQNDSMNITRTSALIATAISVLAEKEVDLVVIGLTRNSLIDYDSFNYGGNTEEVVASIFFDNNYQFIGLSPQELVIQSKSLEKTKFSYKGTDYVANSGDCGMIGVLTAIEIINFIKENFDFSILLEDLKSAITELKIPGYIEKISDNPLLLVDSAESREEISTLIQIIRAQTDRVIIPIYSISKRFPVDKAIIDILSEFEQIILFEPGEKDLLSLRRLEKGLVKSGKSMPIFSGHHVSELFGFIGVNTDPTIFYGDNKDFANALFLAFGNRASTRILREYTNHHILGTI